MQTLPKRPARFLAGLLTAGAAFSLIPSAMAESAAPEAEALVTEAAGLAVTALEDATISDAEADRVLDLVDIDRVAQFSLGNRWGDISAAEQARYVEAFRIYARNQMKQHLSGLTDATVEITDTASRGAGDVIISTRVTTSDSDMPQTISWRVMDNGGWSIVDIEAQDVWFAIQQRAQFEAILDANNGDIDALITEISGSKAATQG